VSGLGLLKFTVRAFAATSLENLLLTKFGTYLLIVIVVVNVVVVVVVVTRGEFNVKFEMKRATLPKAEQVVTVELAEQVPLDPGTK
jgi:hypothetical protein